jgi:hypothetical protein
MSVFPNDFRSVRAFAERSNNIVHWSQFDRGGHFAASDAPDLRSEISGRSSAGSADRADRAVSRSGAFPPAGRSAG